MAPESERAKELCWKSLCNFAAIYCDREKGHDGDCECSTLIIAEPAPAVAENSPAPALTCSEQPIKCPRCGGTPCPATVSTSMMQFPEQYGFCQCILIENGVVGESGRPRFPVTEEIAGSNPADSAKSCSEVVERLAKAHDYGLFDRAATEKILIEWRERRVQELEEWLAKRSGGSHCNDSASTITSTNDSTEIRRSK